MSGNPVRAAFVGELAKQAQLITRAKVGMGALIAQNQAVGGDYITNLTSDDLTLYDANTTLTVAQVQNFYSLFVTTIALGQATDTTTFGNLITALTTLADSLYSQTPPVALDSLTVNMMNA